MRITVLLYTTILSIICNHGMDGFIFNKNGGGLLTPTTTNNLNCNRASSSKFTTITSPTSNLPNDCIYTIRVYSTFVCQLRVDFDMVLMQPTIPSAKNTLTFVDCNSEFMEIDKFKLCGSNRNQHIYLPFNRTAGQTEIQIKFHLMSGSSSFWKLKITQLECAFSGSSLKNALNAILHPKTFITDSYMLAPNGCSQYYTGNSGLITSFNYLNGLGVYPGNLTYSICFHKSLNDNTLQLKSNHFAIGHESTDTIQMDLSCRPNVKTPGRSEDFIFIPEANFDDLQLRATYFCGNVLNQRTITTSTAGPFYMIFTSDDIYSEEIPESGFSFQYLIN